MGGHLDRAVRHHPHRSGEPRQVFGIPLLGMILGNTLNGVSLGLGRLGDELTGPRDQVETLLALGATRWEAARQPIQQAVEPAWSPRSTP